MFITQIHASCARSRNLRYKYPISKRGVPKLGYHFGVTRTAVFGGLYWDFPILGHDQIEFVK